MGWEEEGTAGDCSRRLLLNRKDDDSKDRQKAEIGKIMK